MKNHRKRLAWFVWPCYPAAIALPGFVMLLSDGLAVAVVCALFGITAAVVIGSWFGFFRVAPLSSID